MKASLSRGMIVEKDRRFNFREAPVFSPYRETPQAICPGSTGRIRTGPGYLFLLLNGNQNRPNFCSAEIDKYWDGFTRNTILTTTWSTSLIPH